MDLLKDFVEENWDKFLEYLKQNGIPEEEIEDYANELIKKLR